MNTIRTGPMRTRVKSGVPPRVDRQLLVLAAVAAGVFALSFEIGRTTSATSASPGVNQAAGLQAASVGTPIPGQLSAVAPIPSLASSSPHETQSSGEAPGPSPATGAAVTASAPVVARLHTTPSLVAPAPAPSASGGSGVQESTPAPAAARAPAPTAPAPASSKPHGGSSTGGGGGSFDSSG